jgi:hypothetical protein
MRDYLAERLLGTVLDWEDEDLAKERPIIDVLANLKYDDYQQFKPGFKFIESLALWLEQFEKDEKRTAYNFIKNKLVYISSSEINHLVDIAYPAIIKPILFRQVAEKINIPYWQTKQIAESQYFKELRRRSLFLGLSDGAKIDRFRRTNQELSHEQIYTSYELSIQKIDSLISKLKDDLLNLRGTAVNDDEATFKNIFLLDDFSASGMSMLRMKTNGDYSGKLAKIRHEFFTNTEKLAKLADSTNCNVYSILYIMTVQANEHINRLLSEFWPKEKGCCELMSVLQLENEIKITKEKDKEIVNLIDKYYDEAVFDNHMRVGGTKDVKLGFAGCAIPVALSHNTPNDSIFLLWSYKDKIRGLFPRITRHKEED